MWTTKWWRNRSEGLITIQRTRRTWWSCWRTWRRRCMRRCRCSWTRAWNWTRSRWSTWPGCCVVSSWSSVVSTTNTPSSPRRRPLSTRGTSTLSGRGLIHTSILNSDHIISLLLLLLLLSLSLLLTIPYFTLSFSFSHITTFYVYPLYILKFWNLIYISRNNNIT